MKLSLSLFSIILLLSCTYCNSQENKNPQGVPVSCTENLLQNHSVSDAVKAVHQKLTGITGDLKTFKSYVGNLDDKQVASIALALDYIKTCIPAGNPDQDMIFEEFYKKFYRVTNRFSDSLETNYPSIIKQLDKDSNSAELGAFRDNLKQCGIGIFTTEGIYYPDAIYDFFYTNFNDRVSVGMKEFLSIRKDEMKQGFSEDAELLISFDEVYQRAKRWEKLLDTYPEIIIKEEAGNYYIMYMETLITGMDNSPVFSSENQTLLPEIRILYEKILKEETGSKTTKIISDYYSFLEQHDFKDNDDIQNFLKDNNLKSMQAVQPLSR
jgi:hypothetical protein